MAAKSVKKKKPRSKRLRSKPSHLPLLDPKVFIAQQGTKPITDPSTLYADFWPEDETADDFIAAYRQWRREGSQRSRA
jgi:hypothetical protein